jgi:hypothetical protein
MHGDVPRLGDLESRKCFISKFLLVLEFRLQERLSRGLNCDLHLHHHHLSFVFHEEQTVVDILKK